MHGFSHRIGQHMGSDMELITPQTVPEDWSIHGFRQVIGQSSDSHAGLVRAVIPTQDWPAHGFSHGTDQQMDSGMGLAGARALLWDWSAHQPVSSLCLTLSPVRDPSHRSPLVEHQANPFLCTQTPLHALGCLPASGAPDSAHQSGTHLEGWLRCQNKPWLPQGVLAPQY